MKNIIFVLSVMMITSSVTQADKVPKGLCRSVEGTYSFTNSDGTKDTVSLASINAGNGSRINTSFPVRYMAMGMAPTDVNLPVISSPAAKVNQFNISVIYPAYFESIDQTHREFGVAQYLMSCDNIYAHGICRSSEGAQIEAGDGSKINTPELVHFTAPGLAPTDMMVPVKSMTITGKSNQFSMTVPFAGGAEHTYSMTCSN